MSITRRQRILSQKVLEPPPEVGWGLQLYMDAFWQLASERHGPRTRIPWSSIRFWCRERGMDRDDMDFTQLVLQEIDTAYLNWCASKQEAARIEADRPKREVIHIGKR